MPKRKRYLGDDTSDDGKRRRKMDVSEICQELLDTVKAHKTEDGRVVCEAFIRAPKRRSLADYYEVVSNPMDFCRVQQKIKMEEYEDVEQMTNDVELLINNAKTYYKKESQEYQDACDLWNFYLESKNEILGGVNFTDDSSSIAGGGDDTLSNPGSEGASDDDILEELFSAVMTAMDEGRSLSSMFQLLPSKAKYPDYYTVINEPIDLKTIATKIQNNVYQTLNELDRDLLLMVRNAKAYNEPGSQIYRDANSLRKVILSKKAEIEQRKYLPVKTSERIRAKKLLPSGQKWSTITAALKSENDSDIESIPNMSVMNINEDTLNEETNESDPEDADSNPQWQLYEAVRNYTTNQGITLSDPFNRLPSKRFYPDYYMEIKHPMSLAKIKAKIKSNVYRNSTDVVDDMNLMFENAKRYNRPDSKIFKDACRLQKVMHLKAKELFSYPTKETDSSESDNEDSCGTFSLKKTPPVKSKKSLSSAMTHELKKARRSQQDVDVHMKKRMKLLFKTLVDYVDEMGRPLITLFLEKPSIKDYPDYYDIIEKPIDMKTIEMNIKFDRYTNVDSLVSDFLLMFKNCKHYNEEGSQIYRDAESLEAVLVRKLEELGPFIPSKPKRMKAKLNSSLQQKLRTFYETIVNYTDNKGKQLSSIFMKLPSRVDYPDYYEVTKKPIDLEKIGTKVRSGAYESLDDLLADLVLMFDNACKYNEPDSQIYKSALSLQHVALQTKLELADTRGVPDVKAIVQDILTNLFISTYNHQDEEGRCYSDSLNELFEDVKPSEQNENHLSLDIIKRNLDKGRYRRLDRFQQDMFEVFDRTRKLSRTDSQAFEDSIELQTYFIRLRNELCRNGEILISSALNYTEADLTASVESLKLEKYPLEQQDIEMDSDSKGEKEKEFDSISISGPAESIEEVSLNNVIYRPMDFVLIEPREKSMEPHIIHIQKLWRDSTGEIWINGCWFYRPNETFHIASKKFLEKEVFKSDNYNNTPLGQVVGKCYVMFVKDYFKYKPVNVDEKYVFVCESRYCTRIKAFKKIKVWPYNHNTELVLREHPVPMIRVPSVFKDKTEKPREVEEEDESLTKILDIERLNVPCDTPPEGVATDDGSVYYEQFTIPFGSYKTGDCCYVRTDQGRNLICRIDRIWVDKEGNAFFHGPWFVQPMELPPLTPRMFYPQEVFLSSIEDTNPLLSICDRCAVLDLKDYSSRRPTEIAEQDVYVCESKYLEHEKKFVKLQKEMTKVNHSTVGIVEDEYYIFRKPLLITRSEYGADKSVVVARKGQTEIPSPLTVPLASSETENDESNDVVPIVVNEQPAVSTPVAAIKKKATKRLVTGYIIFASEVRKSVVQANPDCNFGDISRIIGTEWKNLPSDTKAEYEKKAQKQNEDTAKEAAREAERADNYPQSPASAHSQVIENGVYECHWGNKCDFQCEDSQDLYDHLIAEPMGHIWQSYGEVKDKEEPIFQCLFHGCGRVKKGAQPFPSIQRLIRHCKEVHVTKQNPKLIAPENRSKNFTPSRKSVMSPASSSSSSNPSSQTVAPQTTISGIKSQSRSTPPPPALNVESSSGVVSALHSALSMPVGNSAGSQSTTAMPVLSPFWASGNGTGVQAKPVEPLFVAAPAKQNRIVHTNTYLRYMERLRSDCRHVSNWEVQLNATADNTPTPDKSQLPVHWLSNGAGNHGNVVNALWALRNFMFQDTLKITKY